MPIFSSYAVGYAKGLLDYASIISISKSYTSPIEQFVVMHLSDVFDIRPSEAKLLIKAARELSIKAIVGER